MTVLLFQWSLSGKLCGGEGGGGGGWVGGGGRYFVP